MRKLSEHVDDIKGTPIKDVDKITVYKDGEKQEVSGGSKVKDDPDTNNIDDNGDAKLGENEELDEAKKSGEVKDFATDVADYIKKNKRKKPKKNKSFKKIQLPGESTLAGLSGSIKSQARKIKALAGRNKTTLTVVSAIVGASLAYVFYKDRMVKKELKYLQQNSNVEKEDLIKFVERLYNLSLKQAESDIAKASLLAWKEQTIEKINKNRITNIQQLMNHNQDILRIDRSINASNEIEVEGEILEEGSPGILGPGRTLLDGIRTFGSSSIPYTALLTVVAGLYKAVFDRQDKKLAKKYGVDAELDKEELLDAFDELYKATLYNNKTTPQAKALLDVWKKRTVKEINKGRIKSIRDFSAPKVK